jgi:hypothetical protein
MRRNGRVAVRVRNHEVHAQIAGIDIADGGADVAMGFQQALLDRH